MTDRVEWFKLFLDPAVLREGRLATSARLPELPPGKEPVDVVTDYLSCLWQYAKERITEEIGSVADLGESADWISTLHAVGLLHADRGSHCNRFLLVDTTYSYRVRRCHLDGSRGLGRCRMPTDAERSDQCRHGAERSCGRPELARAYAHHHVSSFLSVVTFRPEVHR